MSCAAQGNPQPGTVLWTYDASVQIVSSPAVAPDGTVYFGTSTGLFAVINMGSAASNKWTFSTYASGSPAVDAIGTVYFGSAGGHFYALNPDGTQKWVYPFKTAVNSSAAISRDGTIYVAAEGRLYSLSSTGLTNWSYFIANEDCSPVIGADGTIYIGNHNGGAFFAITSAGALKWSRDMLASGTGESAAIAADGTIYVSAGHLYAFHSNGSNLWSVTSVQFDGSPVVGKDGTVYVAAYGSHILYAISAAGQILWASVGESSQSPSTSPAIDTAGTIYYCVSNSVLALNPHGQVLWTVYARYTPPGFYLATTSPVIGPDGTIYAALGTKLYAIAGTNKLADSPWPMYRQNARHTGKMEKPAQAQPGTILWTYNAGTSIQSSPALASDGTIYIAANGVVAVTNADGSASNKWSFPAQGEPVVGSGGTVYAVGTDLYAINPDGSEQWHYLAGGQPNPPAIGWDNAIYFVGFERLYAISSTGAKLWESSLSVNGYGVQPAVIARDGTIYVGYDEVFYAVTPQGTNKWSIDFNRGGAHSAAVAKNGTIYNTIGGMLRAISSLGTNLWAVDLNGIALWGEPILSCEGAIYVPDTGRRLCAFGPGGEFAWAVLSGLPFGSATAPALDARGTIYYCVSNSLWALNPKGQVQWKFTTSEVQPVGGELANQSPIIGPDGTIYAAIGRYLFAIVGTNGAADSPWPMHRQNARHTGKIEHPTLNQPQKRSDSNFQFQLYAQVDQTQSIQTSTDLVNWAALTGIVVTNVPMNVVDLSASNFPARFYRTQSE